MTVDTLGKFYFPLNFSLCLNLSYICSSLELYQTILLHPCHVLDISEELFVLDHLNILREWYKYILDNDAPLVVIPCLLDPLLFPLNFHLFFLLLTGLLCLLLSLNLFFI